MLPKTDHLFIPFITAGDPNGEATIEIALALQEAGASVIELGIPYSDPIADGLVIQKASARALKNGMNIVKAMELVPEMRKRGLNIPVVLFSYYNPVLQLGEENFFALLHKNMIDGVLIPDIPFEESGQIRLKCKENGIAFITLVAPTSTSRIKTLVENAEGFVYCVSSLGVTGVRNEFDKSITSFIEEVNKYSKVPVAVGFGVSTKEQVEEMNNICDGVIIGSALMKEIERLNEGLSSENTREQAVEEFKNFAKSLIS
ncbi:tryptophan synthase subunit alpha [Metabacillus fastidiosus]|nr:tryptophan synthase subunit alpha [Metabacillus fastidiosus]MED4532182.1 tryptophan synthase subunit alpha [Metabacillus fastidiosus]